MAEIAVLTAIYGEYDTLRPQAAQDLDVDWICVTDNPALAVPAPWAVLTRSPSHEHPCMAAKLFKTLPRSAVDHARVVWIDANMQVTSPTFVRRALGAIREGIATWRHPRRDCIYDEALASVGAESQGGKYAGLPIREQAEHYRAGGHPEHGGLFACGTVAWDLSDARATALGGAWMAECERWTFQDQISLPVVAQRLGVNPGIFPLAQIQRRRRGWLENDWLRIHPHG